MIKVTLLHPGKPGRVPYRVIGRFFFNSMDALQAAFAPHGAPLGRR